MNDFFGSLMQFGFLGLVLLSIISIIDVVRNSKNPKHIFEILFLGAGFRDGRSPVFDYAFIILMIAFFVGLAVKLISN
ncbi:hypothetical protein [Aliamphritea ceti]|uniref:hypothetical protein n=1 Tax=Aliamphritea ceti TaxID=1524258 RepID=UPI0021C36723|nr:hypothetical protein [Aliamphritea ceti]